MTLRYDPYDLTRIEVWYEGEQFADAVPHRLRRHSHRSVQTAQTGLAMPAPTGLNLLELVRKETELRRGEQLGQTSYASLVIGKGEIASD